MADHMRTVRRNWKGIEASVEEDFPFFLKTSAALMPESFEVHLFFSDVNRGKAGHFGEDRKNYF